MNKTKALYLFTFGNKIDELVGQKGWGVVGSKTKSVIGFNRSMLLRRPLEAGSGTLHMSVLRV